MFLLHLASESGVRKGSVASVCGDYEDTSCRGTGSYGQVSQVYSCNAIMYMYILCFSARIQELEESFHRREERSVLCLRMFCVHGVCSCGCFL